MKISWRVESDRLVCRWSEEGERVEYSPGWMQDASSNVSRKKVVPSFLHFTRFSALGGRRWYDPDPGYGCQTP